MINYYLNNTCFTKKENLLKLYCNTKTIELIECKINIIKLENIDFKIIFQTKTKIKKKNIQEYGFAEGYNCDLILTINIDNEFTNGVYYVELIIETTKYYIPFFINKEKTSDILLLFNTFTWNCYNTHNELYPDSLTNAYKYKYPKNKFCSNKKLGTPFYSTKLSFNRTNESINTDINRIINNTNINDMKPVIRNKEYYHNLMPLYLNNNNISYDCITDEFLDDPNNIDIINQYKCIIINTHSEYWSKNSVININKFIQNKGNVVNLSGNTMYWCVLYNNCERTLEIRKHRFCDYNPKYFKDNPYDKNELKFSNAEQGGLWYDLEKEIYPYLSTNLFLNNSYYPIHTGKYENFNAPLKILNIKNWVFDCLVDSEIEKDKYLIGINSLNDTINNKLHGASGWEIDRIVDDKYKKYIIMEGLNKDNDNNDVGCQVVLVEDDINRGRIFSAPSISYTASLYVDENLMKITNHVIRIFSH